MLQDIDKFTENYRVKQGPKSEKRGKTMCLEHPKQGEIFNVTDPNSVMRLKVTKVTEENGEPQTIFFDQYRPGGGVTHHKKKPYATFVAKVKRGCLSNVRKPRVLPPYTDPKTGCTVHVYASSFAEVEECPPFSSYRWEGKLLGYNI